MRPLFPSIPHQSYALLLFLPFFPSLATHCPFSPSLGCHGGRKLRRCTGHMGGSEPYGQAVSRHICNIWLLVLACQLLSLLHHRLPLILLTASPLFNFSLKPHPHVLYSVNAHTHMEKNMQIKGRTTERKSFFSCTSSSSLLNFALVSDVGLLFKLV